MKQLESARNCESTGSGAAAERGEEQVLDGGGLSHSFLSSVTTRTWRPRSRPVTVTGTDAGLRLKPRALPCDHSQLWEASAGNPHPRSVLCMHKL